MSEKEGAKLETDNKDSAAESSANADIFEISLLQYSSASDEGNKRVVILLPGAEGIMAALQPVADSLKGDVFCSQYCGKSEDHSVLGVTAELLPVS